MKGRMGFQSLQGTVHTEPSPSHSSDFLATLMAEMPASARNISRSILPATAADLKTQRKVESIVEKVDLEVRAWLRDRKTAPQVLVLSLRRLLERELRPEVSSKRPATAFSAVIDLKTRKNSLNRTKSPSRSISTLAIPSVFIDFDFLQLSAAFTDSVKRFLAENKLKTVNFTLKLAKMRQELTSGVAKMEAKLAELQKTKVKPVVKSEDSGKEAKKAVEYMSKMLLKEESRRWKQVKAAQNGLFAKVARLLERLKSVLGSCEQARSQQMQRNASISSLGELHGDFRSIKQLLETCLPASPQPHTSFPSFDQWSESTDLWEKLRRKEEEVGSLQREMSRMKETDSEKWLEVVLESIRLDSQLEVAVTERDQATAQVCELRTELEGRLKEAVSMVKEDYSGSMQRLLTQHYGEIKALRRHIWELEEAFKDA